MSKALDAALLALSAGHRAALAEAVAWIRAELDPLGIVATGSIVRGEGHAGSDLDVVVLWRGPGRRRIQRRFVGVPAEVFANTDDWLRRSMDDEAREGRPVMAHMLATGVLLADDDTGTLARLVDEARAQLAAGLGWSDEAVLRHRYHAACLVEDALDLLADEPEDGAGPGPDAHLAVTRALDALVAHAFLGSGAWLPRPKTRWVDLERRDADAARSVAEVLRVLDGLHRPEVVHRALRRASWRIAGVEGFFEWDSGGSSGLPSG